MRAPKTKTHMMEKLEFRHRMGIGLQMARALRTRGGNTRSAASDMGISTSSWYSWMQTHWDPPLTDQELKQEAGL